MVDFVVLAGRLKSQIDLWSVVPDFDLGCVIQTNVPSNPFNLSILHAVWYIFQLTFSTDVKSVILFSCGVFQYRYEVGARTFLNLLPGTGRTIESPRARGTRRAAPGSFQATHVPRPQRFWATFYVWTHIIHRSE